MNPGADLKEAKKTLFDEYLIILKYEFNKAKLKYRGKQKGREMQNKNYEAITEEHKKKVIQHCRMMKYHSINAKILLDDCQEQIKLDGRKLSWWDRIDNNHVSGNLGGLH